QTPRLLARFADIRPEPGDLLELLFGRREWRARENDAGHRVHGGDLGERRGAVPAVDRQSKGPADPNVVERLALVGGSHQVAAVPIAGLDVDLVAELAHELAARRRRKAPELDCGAVRADRVDPNRLLGGKDANEPVEIGLSLAIIVGIAHPLDRLADLVADEFERAGAHDVLLEPAWILVENLFLVDPGVGVGE